MPETRLSIRQRIINAIVDRFSLIHQNNSYATNVGTHCFAWRDLDKSPWTLDELADGGGITIYDQERDSDPSIVSAHDQVLHIEVSAASSADGYTPPDNHARRIEADLLTAIGVDRQWGGLAKDTIPGKSVLGVGHIGDLVAWVKLNFRVLFRTARFDPYTQ